MQAPFLLAVFTALLSYTGTASAGVALALLQRDTKPVYNPPPTQPACPTGYPNAIECMPVPGTTNGDSIQYQCINPQLASVGPGVLTQGNLYTYCCKEASAEVAVKCDDKKCTAQSLLMDPVGSVLGGTVGGGGAVAGVGTVKPDVYYNCVPPTACGSS